MANGRDAKKLEATRIAIRIMEMRTAFVLRRGDFIFEKIFLARY